jgi:hypothetical protein
MHFHGINFYEMSINFYDAPPPPLAGHPSEANALREGVGRRKNLYLMDLFFLTNFDFKLIEELQKNASAF